MKVYESYVKEQVKHPNAIIVKRLGDFYEVFGLGAKIVADEMNFTITGRECGIEERVLMVGFPFCMCDEVISKLKEKYEVVITEN